jgi:hypothetical protein
VHGLSDGDRAFFFWIRFERRCARGFFRRVGVYESVVGEFFRSWVAEGRKLARSMGEAAKDNVVALSESIVEGCRATAKSCDVRITQINAALQEMGRELTRLVEEGCWSHEETKSPRGRR